MNSGQRHLIYSFLLWASVLTAVIVPLGLAASSPLLEWREPVYRIAGFAGVLGLALMLLQPLLASGFLPGVGRQRGRYIHRITGTLLLFCVFTHVAALWVTSPPDVVDALLFVSPTPFSVWGVIAMWAVFFAAIIALLRYRLPIRVWRLSHTTLVTVTIAGTVLHALLIEGTMETISKIGLCLLVILALGKTVYDLRVWAVWRRRQQ